MGELENLARELFYAKKAERVAKDARIAVEEKIAALVETGERGSKTVEAGDMRITVKRGFSYSADIEKLVAAGLDCVLKTKTELDERAYEALRADNPEAFGKAAEYVTVKPKKVAVELKI